MTRQKKYPISYLLLKVRFGSASEDEKREVGQWIKLGEGRDALYKYIASGSSLQDHLKLIADFDRFTNYEKVETEIRTSLKRRRQRRNLFRYTFWTGTAAACLIGLIILLHKQPETTSTPRPVAKVFKAQSLVNDKVVLVLNNGQQIGMSTKSPDSIKLNTATAITGVNRLVYNSHDSLEAETLRTQPEINKIITSSGGFYTIVLCDGSKIWLNSESELEYPVFFIGEERRVKLSGEAYFEIARDTEHPFIVETSGIRTKVLGTSFNIKAYKDENTINTTLVTGKVDVISLNDSTCHAILHPGKQANWYTDSRQIDVQDADLNRVLAWKEGMFAFNREDIKVVTRQIERWYGVKFIYPTGGLEEQYTFSGRFSKGEKLETILQELTFIGGPQFKIKGNEVYIEHIK